MHFNRNLARTLPSTRLSMTPGRTHAVVVSSVNGDAGRLRCDASTSRGKRHAMAERPVFGDYFSLGACLDSDFGSAALRLASRLAVSRLPIRRMTIQASTLRLRVRAVPCSQL